MTEKKGKDKRKVDRIPLSLEVSYTVNSKYKEEVMDGELQNITDGVGGICLKVSTEPAVGSQMMLKFGLPNSKCLFATGKIVWTNEDKSDRKFLIGVEFDLDDEDIDYLKKELML